ncbi:HpcH/HpaI aldolase/citrate lyase family protein [Phytohabitans suffuscus]
MLPLTWLYVPGDRPDRFAKALASGADAVILDLEDAVAAPRKAYARSAVAEFVAEPRDPPVHVRIATASDVPAVRGATGLRLPKIETPEQVRAIADLTEAELHPLIESAAGVENAYRIATAHPAVAGIALGEADLRSDLGISDEAALAWPRGRIVVAARAAGLPPPAMSVYPDISDMDGLAASCRLGRRQGFLGRAAIHPRQLPVIAAAFRPAPDEVARAKELLAAMADAAGAGEGTVVLADGRFADRAMLGAARRVVELAARYT